MDREKKFKRKRLCSYIVALGYVFFGGCEDVVIFPTAWDYIQTLGVTEEYWLGFTISIYSVAAIFAGLIGGRLADKYQNQTKVIVLTCIIFRALGNFQYTLGISIWNVLVSRMICGIGAASGTSLVAEVCRITTMNERKSYLSGVTAAFHFGILMGPALQVFISYFDFTIFGFQVTPINAPGMFMGILWSIYFLLIIFLYTNLSQEFKEIQKEKQLQSSISSQEDFSSSLEGKSEGGKIVESDVKKPSIRQMYIDEFLTDSYVFLMWLVFTLYFQQCGLETVIPVIVEENFGFNVRQTTMIYWSGGLEALTAFIALAFIGKYVRESTLIMTGLFFMTSAHVWLFCVMPYFEKGNPSHAPYFLVGTFLFYLAGPITNVGNSSLASKVLSQETQGLGQGFRRLMSYVGVIFGPTWAGATVHQPRLFMGVTLVILMTNVGMLAVSFKTLRAAEKKMMEQNSVKSEESTPLLSSNSCS